MTELALSAPLVLTAGLFGLESANLAITHMKVSQSSMMIADNASRIGDETLLQDRRIYEIDVTDLMRGADLQMGEQLDIFQHGRVVLSSLETDPDDDAEAQQYIHWQRCMGKLKYEPQFGKEGDGKGDPSFTGMGPSGEEVMAPPGGAVIFVEVAYEYQPIITDAFISDRIITTYGSFIVRESRDLREIYQKNPLLPDDPATCDKYERFRTHESPRRESGGWDWKF
uniref:pilus assembly protein n=1 Tax=Parerythrobacter lutipelagi TaxID=1964208 RepID=UPI0010F8F2F6|nr:pilus assembly protein [Parerythrobacter lutipelagi]